MNKFLCILILFHSLALAGGVANVTLVINDKSALSRRLGEFYASWHGLPKSQVCRISTIEEETINRSGFEKQIAAPISDCLRRNDRVESTFYLVLTQGMPIRVSAEAKNDNASVDSELALLYLEMHGSKIERTGWVDNPFYRKKDQPFSHPGVPIYLVTRLAGYSFEDARKAVERCRGAKNVGRVVLDLKADNDDDGNSWLRNAGIILPEPRVVFETTPTVLTAEKQVIGYASWGSNDRARKSRKSGMEWLPGAIATEFVSSNARTLKMPPYTWTLGEWKNPLTYFAGSPQSMILDYVWEGVSGISGNIDEPYLSQTVRPDQLFPAYLAGRNLAESFYLALPSLSWQSLIVGDPLCRLE
ncbi:MAG: TIGR03790 family protein [Acidobacteria bacterium]|nr:TIGR03790 family protein [Acidobacteriota bacterium]